MSTIHDPSAIVARAMSRSPISPLEDGLAAGSSFAAEDDAFDVYLKEKNMDGVYEELGIASDLGDNDEAAERKRGK